MKLPRRSVGVDIFLTLVFASLVSLGLYAYAVHQAGYWVFSYLPFNLCLAWIPLLLVGALMRLLQHKLWSSWSALLLTIAWIVFLPNSFYMVTDFIHLQSVYSANIVADAVMITSFAFTGLLLGFTSLYIVHRALARRLSFLQAFACVGLILAVCSLAIYIGRDLRWSSWDLLTNPTGLLFDLSDRLLHPSDYGSIFSVAFSFFVLLGGIYLVIWHLLHITRRNVRRGSTSPLI
jgi:uncharacterized membrane protein